MAEMLVGTTGLPIVLTVETVRDNHFMHKPEPFDEGSGFFILSSITALCSHLAHIFSQINGQ
jgi:hypothetical protein